MNDPLEHWDHASSAFPNETVYTPAPYVAEEQRWQDGEGPGASQASTDKAQVFQLENMGYSYMNELGGIRCMAAARKTLMLVTERGFVLRWNVETGEIDGDKDPILRPNDAAAARLFLDPTGQHALVCCESGDNYYVPPTVRKYRPLTKVKAVVTSVAWNRARTSSQSTREILLGTSRGQILECVIDGGKDKATREVYDLGTGEGIVGVDFEYFPPRSRGQANQARFFVLVATATRYYHFTGGPTFTELFAAYRTTPGFVELTGDIASSEMRFLRLKEDGRARMFVWSTAQGVYSGRLQFGQEDENVIADYRLTAYPDDESSAMRHPVAVAPTELHILLVFRDRVVAVNQLSDEVVFEQRFSQAVATGLMQGICIDDAAGDVWLFSDRSILRVLIREEDRDMWRLHLRRSEFESALAYCKNETQRDVVLTAHADAMLKGKNFDAAAIKYAQTQRSLEEVALLFMNQGQRDALMVYLEQKLMKIPAGAKSQLTVLCTWLTEMYLDKLNEADAKPPSAARDAQIAAIREEWRNFLVDNRDYLDRSTTFDLITSHGRVDEMLFYAGLVGDNQRILAHCVQHGEWEHALKILESQDDEDLFYVYSPILMANRPYDTVKVWLVRAAALNPRRLIPAMLRYNHAMNPATVKENQVIRFLQYSILKHRCSDPAVHNYLLTLYAKDKDEQSLLRFLQNPNIPRCVDLEYALRVCTECGLLRVCVYIYSQMQMFEEAVDLSLTLKDLDLARENADMPEDDESLRKKLWLRIARFVIEEKNDIREAIDVMRKSEILRIEDILPYFPDFVVIDAFKDEICESLKVYNDQINDLKQNMDEATESAKRIRQEIKEIRNRYHYVPGNRKCDITGEPLLSREFYLFPCQHAFHQDALVKEMMVHLPASERSKLERTMSDIKKLEAAGGNEEGAPVNIVTQLEKLRAEVDDVVAKECVLCGNVMVQSIDRPFIEDSEKEEVLSWQI